MIDIVRVDDIPASDVGESLSGTGATSRSGDPLIIAGKCSGFDTELITQTAALQMQKGGGVMYLILMTYLSLQLMIFL